MDCDVAEVGLVGEFEPEYNASGSDSTYTVDEDGCHFTDVESGDENFCMITNLPAPIEVTINKVWDIVGSENEDIPQYFELALICDGPIVGGQPWWPPIGPLSADAAQSLISQYSVVYFQGEGDETFEAMVYPMDPETKCNVEEYYDKDYMGLIESDNGCDNIELELGDGEYECTITNTVFYEGIPTLSQWGMAIMALLMLGVGMVGFRRYV